MQIDPNDLTQVTKRLRRAQGQIGGILKMIEEGRECRDFDTQMAAVSKALDRAGFAMISTGLKQCMVDESADSGEFEAMEKLFLSLA